LHGQIHVEHAEELTEETLIEKITGARTQDESKISAEARRLKQKEAEQKKHPTPKKELTSAITTSKTTALVFRDEEAVIQSLKTVREKTGDIQNKNWVYFFLRLLFY
jgi:hypothetical protein